MKVGYIVIISIIIIIIIFSIVGILHRISKHSEKAEIIFEKIAFVTILVGLFSYGVHTILRIDYEFLANLGLKERLIRILSSSKTYQEFATFATLLGLLGFLDQSSKSKNTERKSFELLNSITKALGIQSPTFVDDVQQKNDKVLTKRQTKDYLKIKNDNIMLIEERNIHLQLISDYENQITKLKKSKTLKNISE